MNDKQQTETKKLAVKVINKLWPSIRIRDVNLTPDVVDYVFRVLICAKDGHRIVKSLAPALGLATSWRSIAIKLIKAVRNYTDKKQDWGMAIRGAVAAHQRHILNVMKYGTEIYPLQFRCYL